MPESYHEPGTPFAVKLADALALVLSGDGTAPQALKALYEPPPRSGSRSTVSESQQVAVFLRDQFTCRYCGRRLVFLPLLRLLSAMYPQLFPYHPNWKMTSTHIAYWRDTASCDHILPIARCGNSSMDNLATACYRCNDTKSSWSLEQLGWMLQPITNLPWDGLSSQYLQLQERNAEIDPRYHQRWRRALINAGVKPRQ